MEGLIELLSNMQRLSLLLISLLSCLLKIVIKRSRIVTLPLSWHTTPASSLCPQFPILCECTVIWMSHFQNIQRHPAISDQFLVQTLPL